MTNLPSVAELLDAIPKFEQRRVAGDFGYKLKEDFIFSETAVCMDMSSWDDGIGLSNNRDNHLAKAFRENGPFAVSVVMRMMDNDEG